jgi:lysophospholipase L1-like esterase
MRKAIVAFASLTLLGTAAPSETQLPAHVGGRVIEETDGLSFGWPGTYFESRFEGTGLRLRFETSTEHLRLVIDGEETAVFREPGAVDVTFSDLPRRAHTVRLEKLTESQSGGALFRGFYLPSEGTARPPEQRATRIEFIGDSYTVGYGNRSVRRECTRDEVHDLTDTQQAFGPLLAKRLNADYRVHAYSGFGIVRNYAGSSPESSLPQIYPRLRPDTPSRLRTSQDGWRPDLIVINLGTNDFSTPLKAGERWRSDADLKSDFRAKYLEFVRDLHRQQPKARFILMGSDAFISEVRKVAAELGKARAAPRVVQFSGLDLMGCDWHPSLADHKLLADLLEKEIRGSGLR